MILIDVEEGHPALHAQLTSSRVLVPGYRFFLTAENRQESPSRQESCTFSYRYNPSGKGNQAVRN